MVKAVVYARIFSSDEDIDNQVKSILDWARRNGYNIVRVFRDEDEVDASSLLKRKVFKDMLGFCRNNSVKTILVYDFSRLGKGLRETVDYLKQLLEEGFTVIFTRSNMKAYLEYTMGKSKISLLLMSVLSRDLSGIKPETIGSLGLGLEEYKEAPVYGKNIVEMTRPDNYAIEYQQLLRYVNNPYYIGFKRLHVSS
ncbi:recombinase family protein [Desulfurococcaceae archaeon MEX13E-LK6-19]|nr:recombinase family protein [Desulfurococcaceae archaeon MEX13E-LK6-19]